jgi:hypothetical protein
VNTVADTTPQLAAVERAVSRTLLSSAHRSRRISLALLIVSRSMGSQVSSSETPQRRCDPGRHSLPILAFTHAIPVFVHVTPILAFTSRRPWCSRNRPEMDGWRWRSAGHPMRR